MNADLPYRITTADREAARTITTIIHERCSDCTLMVCPVCSVKNTMVHVVARSVEKEREAADAWREACEDALDLARDICGNCSACLVDGDGAWSCAEHARRCSTRDVRAKLEAALRRAPPRPLCP